MVYLPRVKAMGFQKLKTWTLPRSTDKLFVKMGTQHTTLNQ